MFSKKWDKLLFNFRVGVVLRVVELVFVFRVTGFKLVIKV